MALAGALVVARVAEGTTTKGKLTLRVGEQLEFAAAPGVSGVVEWRLDDRVVGDAVRWTFVPSAADVGLHRVTVSVTPAGGRSRTQTWSVRVRLPHSVRVVEASPAAELLQVPVDDEVMLHFEVASREEGERVDVAWTIDDASAGKGPVLRVSRAHPSSLRVRALAVGSLGTAVAHEWRVVFEPRSTTSTSAAPRPTTTTPPLRPTWPSPLMRRPTVTPPSGPEPLPPTPPSTPAPVALPPPSGSGPTRAQVTAFMEEVAAAWRHRNIAALRRLGQITSDESALALEEYLNSVQDLEVQIELLEVIPTGDRAIVH